MMFLGLSSMDCTGSYLLRALVCSLVFGHFMYSFGHFSGFGQDVHQFLLKLQLFVDILCLLKP